MDYRLGSVILLIMMLLLPPMVSGDLGIIVETDVSGYIMEDHLNLTGTTNTSTSFFEDANTTNFDQGTSDYLIVEDDKVVLKSEQSYKLLNGGSAVLSPGTGGAWDTILIDLYVVKHNGTYWMYYTGCRSTHWMSAWHIGVATSTDGINFTKYASNPVVKARVNSYDYTNVMQPVVRVINGKFHMWYGGNHGNRDASELQNVDICYATSTDGFNWTKYSGNPVIKNGSPNSAFDGIELRPAELVQVGSNYTLFYKAVGTTGGQGAKPKLGSHTSTNLVTWTENPNNPLYKPPSTTWEGEKTNYMSVERVGSKYRMWTWVSLSTQKVGWLYSTDLENWADSGGPVISPKSGTIYSTDVAYPRLVQESGNDLLYFRGTSGGTRRFGVFEIIPTAQEGNYTSRVLDARAKVDLRGIDWDWTSAGGGWIGTSLRWTNDTGSWGPWTTFNNTTEPLGVQARYYQYRVTLNASSSPAETSLNSFRLDYSIPVTNVEVSVDGAAYLNASGDLPGWWANVSVHDGDYDVLVRATDALGNRVTTTLPVRVDLYPPTGSILVEDGRMAVGSTTVNIQLAAYDAHGPFQMQLSRKPDFAGATWQDLVTNENWQLLGDPEGNVTIYARFRDDAGRVSEAYNDSIIVDTTPPTGALRINGGDRYTNSTAVDLSLTWADLTGVVAMEVSNDPQFRGAVWQDPMTSLRWTLDDNDGERAVYVRIRDMVGWETTLTDTIVLDTTPPSADMSINGDGAFTDSLDAFLFIDIYDITPVRIKLANSDGPWPDTFSTLASPAVVPWVLSPGEDGVRRVRMLMMDAAGNVNVTSDDIVLDTGPPAGQLELQGGEAYTNVLAVEASLVASDPLSGLDGMRIGVTEDLRNMPWQAVAETFSWLIPSGDGTKTVHVELRDRAGNTVTIQDSIVLDTTPPSGTLAIEGGGEYVATSLVTLLIDMNDANGLVEMRLTNAFGFTDEEWAPYSTSHPWDLGTSGGPKMVFIEVMDVAGNTFTTAVSTNLDLLDPYAHLEIELGAEATLALEVNASWSAHDNVGLASIALSEDPSFEGARWFDLEGGRTVEEVVVFELSPGDGLKTVHVRVVDLAGRTGETSDEIWYVSERPEGTITLGDGSGWSKVSRVAVTASWTGGSEATHFRVSMSEDVLGEWSAIDGTTTVVLGPVGGPKTVYAQLLGPHNVTSLVFDASIALDLEAPTVEISSPRDEVVKDETVTLSVAVSDDLDPSPVVRWRVNGGEWRGYAEDTKLGLKDGDNRLEVEAVDAAGNVASAEWSVTLDRSFLVSGTSWLIILAIALTVGAVSFWYWRRRDRLEGVGPSD